MPLVDRKGAAQAIGVSVGYITAHRDEIPSYKKGSLVRYDPDEVIAWFKSLPENGAASIHVKHRKATYQRLAELRKVG